MKGYLQRLALGVMEPVAVIRPLVGSVFSAPNHAGVRQSLPLGESVFSSSRAKPAQLDPQEGSEDLSVADRQKPMPPAPGLLYSRVPEPEYTPLMSKAAGLQNNSPTNQWRSTPTKNSSPVQEAAKPGEDGLRAKTVPEPGALSEPRQQHDGEKAVYGPIMTEDDGHSERQQTISPRANSFPADTRDQEQRNPLWRVQDNLQIYKPIMTEGGNRSGARQTIPPPANSFPADRPKPENLLSSSRAIAREPDEIEIHIGRIEVTAVQQTSAAPVAKPARKGLSLDEYLRRANGRVR
jgi:hypothetical protein